MDQCYQRINRNIVECKVYLRRQVNKHDQVLIETLWNVKYFLLIKTAPAI